jgi:hypothetical protein
MIAGSTYSHRDWWEEYMKYAVEMGSGSTINVHTTFHKDCFRHSEVVGGRNRHRQLGDLTNVLLFL